MKVRFNITNLTPSGIASSVSNSGKDKNESTVLETDFAVEVLSGPPSALDWEDTSKKVMINFVCLYLHCIF